jgi:hypothetical protein
MNETPSTSSKQQEDKKPKTQQTLSQKDLDSSSYPVPN